MTDTDARIDRTKSFTHKFVPLLHAAAYSANWKAHGHIVVATNGCFDILNVNHISMLETAKSFGTKLIVGIDTERAIHLAHGNLPMHTKHHRATVIAALEVVDLVVMMNEAKVNDFLEIIYPSVWVQSLDHFSQTFNTLEIQTAKKVGARIELLNGPYRVSTINVPKTRKRC